MRRWLFKSEPDAFSIDDLEREGRTEWSGVRSFQARNLMREMHAGDLGLFYHSSTKPPGVVGIVEVIAEAHPDWTQFERASEYYDRTSKRDDPKWWCVDVKFVRKLPRAVTPRRAEGDARPRVHAAVRRGQRLSVQPVTPQEWDVILRLSERAAQTA